MASAAPIELFGTIQEQKKGQREGLAYSLCGNKESA